MIQDGVPASADPRSYHRRRRVVGPGDIDELGHVNNVVYLALAESMAREHAERVGMDLRNLRRLGAIPVVRKHEIRYHRPAREGDALLLETMIDHGSGPRSRRHHWVRLLDGTLLAEVHTDWVWLDPVRLRPKAPPAEILGAFGVPAAREASRT